MIERFLEHLVLTTALLMVGAILEPGRAAGQAGQSLPVFERDVLPILTEHCSKCHNQHTAQAGLDLSTEATVLKGSQNGPVIVKGSSEKSFLFQRVSSHTMPPPGTEKPLDEAQIEALRKWIDSIGGNEQPEAKEPKTPASEPNIPEVSDKDRQFWAFRKPERSAVPKTKNTQRVRTPVDAFLLSKLEARALTFSPDAPKLTLLRRATFDLLGLPPPLEEAQAFLADTRPDAYERLVDRLLASPHYGERWGRHWLDAAGYTDEQGFANDLKTVVFNEGIWRYRDYVVRSFNQDKPYDQFLTEQLAGDELVDWRTAPKYTPEILDSLIATGYLRTAMDLTDAPEVNHRPYYFDVLTRLVDNFSSGILGLTGGCARCHSHKYDPIPQQDYYRLMAIFATGYNPDEWIQPKDRFLPNVSKAEQEEIARFNAEIDRPLNELKKQLEDLRHPYEQRLFESKLAAVPEPLRADVRTAFETPEKKRTDIQKYFFKKLESLLKVSPEEVDKALSESERTTSAKLQGKIATLTGWRRSSDKVQALWDVGKPPKVHLFRRGNWETPGIEVEPGFFSVLSEPGKSQAARPADTKGDSSGCRLALARWLTRRDHPLTARVMVNRIWMHHFGKGIVATPENFGRTGSPPTHPELLDWLAVDFMENGWKLKRLHKLIMTSTAYRQSSRQPPEGQESMAEKVDPSNDLLWRMNLRRIEAEVVRDSVLAVSGKLDQTPGGPPIHLEGAADGLVTASEKDSSPNGLWRRSIYLMARRNYSLSLLDVFDFPVMALNCTRRTNSATPLQSLTLLNSEFTMQRAEDFAVRVNGLVGPNVPTEKKVEMAFLLALARKPTADETRWSALHFEKQRQRYLGLKTSAEESSKRALASLCQMLLGTNEFLYVE